MRIVAVLSVRNECDYLENCLSHLMRNGIEFAIVDNASTDGSEELARSSRFQSHLAGFRSVPFRGQFFWQEMLEAQNELLNEIKADWHLLTAPDEILHSYRSDETLAAAIERLASQGYNVINFDEFVFLPIDNAYQPNQAGMQPMRHYYFYQPRYPNQMRAWLKTAKFSSLRSGGHQIDGEDIRMAPETLALRHYIFRSQDHALLKYTTRHFAQQEIGQGWHWDRINQLPLQFVFPEARQLKQLAHADDRLLDRSDPHDLHYWEERLAAMRANPREAIQLAQSLTPSERDTLLEATLLAALNLLMSQNPQTRDEPAQALKADQSALQAWLRGLAARLYQAGKRLLRR